MYEINHIYLITNSNCSRVSHNILIALNFIFLQKCLVRDPYSRASIDDLLHHPFMMRNIGSMFDLLTSFNILPPQTTAELAKVGKQLYYEFHSHW